MIVHPVSKKIYNIFDKEGRQLLKEYISFYKTGGAETAPVKPVKDVPGALKEVRESVRKILHEELRKIDAAKTIQHAWRSKRKSKENNDGEEEAAAKEEADRIAKEEAAAKEEAERAADRDDEEEEEGETEAREEYEGPSIEEIKEKIKTDRMFYDPREDLTKLFIGELGKKEYEKVFQTDEDISEGKGKDKIKMNEIIKLIDGTAVERDRNNWIDKIKKNFKNSVNTREELLKVVKNKCCKKPGMRAKVFNENYRCTPGSSRDIYGKKTGEYCSLNRNKDTDTDII